MSALSWWRRLWLVKCPRCKATQLSLVHQSVWGVRVYECENGHEFTADGLP